LLRSRDSPLCPESIRNMNSRDYSQDYCLVSTELLDVRLLDSAFPQVAT
jgi:hypothetical protein